MPAHDPLITMRDSALNRLIADLSNAKDWELAAAHHKGYTLGWGVGYLIGLLVGVGLGLLVSSVFRRAAHRKEERLAR